jgi:hypothetical protein
MNPLRLSVRSGFNALQFPVDHQPGGLSQASYLLGDKSADRRPLRFSARVGTIHGRKHAIRAKLGGRMWGSLGNEMGVDAERPHVVRNKEGCPQN